MPPGVPESGTPAPTVTGGRRKAPPSQPPAGARLWDDRMLDVGPPGSGPLVLWLQGTDAAPGSCSGRPSEADPRRARRLASCGGPRRAHATKQYRTSLQGPPANRGRPGRQSDTRATPGDARGRQSRRGSAGPLGRTQSRAGRAQPQGSSRAQPGVSPAGALLCLLRCR